MKKYFSLLLFVCTIQISAVAQNIGINATGAAPNASAILDVSSTSKGLLMPRMTTLQRNAIATPAEGLKVYDTDTKTFWFYNGIEWIQSATGSAVNFWSLNGTNIFNNNAGNVGIGLNTPLASLHIKNDLEAVRLQGITPYISFYDNAGVNKSFIQNFNSDLYLGTPCTNTTGKMQFYLKNIPAITLLPSGNVGIGTDVPDEKLTVQTLNNSYGIFHRGEGGNILGTRMGGTSAGIGTFSNTNMRIFANGNSAMFINSANSYVGMGVDFPTNKLQIGSIGNTGYAGNDFAFGDGTNALRMYQTSTVSLIASSADILFWPKEKAGHVGINCVFPPTNKLQVGDMGGTGFATNDLAIGNGTNAMAIYQTNASTLIGATTDIVLKPKNNGNGFVGINTNTPRCALDVAGKGNINYLEFAFYAMGPNSSSTFLPTTMTGGAAGALNDVTIYASNRILAAEFNAFSDARIKDIACISNAAEDLTTMNAIKIVNYTMKDKIMYGNKKFKKVIAQEVEKVYPQVISKHTDFIPNVYQLTNTLKYTTDGCMLSFTGKHNISHNAKKLQVLVEGKGMEPFDIVSIPSVNEVVINATEIKGEKVFVYGEEVNDFRTVDYEGLTTLNISATQELNKLIKKQAAMIDNLEKRLAALESKPLQRMVGIK